MEKDAISSQSKRLFKKGNRVNFEEAHEFNEEDPPRQGR